MSHQFLELIEVGICISTLKRTLDFIYNESSIKISNEYQTDYTALIEETFNHVMSIKTITADTLIYTVSKYAVCEDQI